MTEMVRAETRSGVLKRMSKLTQGRLKACSARRSLFPREALAKELELRQLSAYRAAQQSGLHRTSVSLWLRGETVPREETFIRFLEGNSIDRAPFQAFLTARDPLTVTLVCPDCGCMRALPRYSLKEAGTAAKGRKALRRLADGLYERRCWTCSGKRHGFPLVQQIQERKLEQHLGKAAASTLIEEAKAGDQQSEEQMRRLIASTAFKRPGWTPEEFTAYVRRPKPESHRRAIGLGNLVARAVKRGFKRPFSLCPLCGLIRYGQQWHRVCWYTWFRWFRREMGRKPRKGEYPPHLRQRGPNPETNLARDYQWLIERRVAKQSRRTLVRREGSVVSVKSAVTKGIRAYLFLSPGSWDLQFCESEERSANAHRQKFIPLPAELERIGALEKRDPLIRRLLKFGMKEEDVSRLTGVNLARVKGIAARMNSGRAATA